MQISKSEYCFIRDLVRENGLYKKDENVKVDDKCYNFADYSIRGIKNGTVVDVSLTECLSNSEETSIPSVEVEGKTYVINKVPLNDTGLVDEVSFFCAEYLVQKMSNEEKKKKRSIHACLEREDKISINKVSKVNTDRGQKTKTYGVVDENFFVSPIREEQLASDSVVHISSANEKISRITIEKGILPSLLKNILNYHISANN